MSQSICYLNYLNIFNAYYHSYGNQLIINFVAIYLFITSQHLDAKVSQV